MPIIFPKLVSCLTGLVIHYCRITLSKTHASQPQIPHHTPPNVSLRRYHCANPLGFHTCDKIIYEFGSRPIRNWTHKELGDYTSATFEVCYDVLNNIAIKSVFGRGNSYEVALATDMLDSIKSNDLLICDRGYVSYRFFAELAQRGINYIIRCPCSSFNEINAMFKPAPLLLSSK